jgi:hypothetical protein
MLMLISGVLELVVALSSLNESNLPSLYRSQLVRDLRKRVRNDPDFVATKFPTANRILNAHSVPTSK